jgi:enolase-phosphatase E1
LPLPSGGNSIQAILLDIEGTSTPIDFVYRTLFPYARRKLESFLVDHREDPAVRSDIEALRMQHSKDTHEQLKPPRWDRNSPQVELASAAAHALWLMDRDSKCSALKSLQGKIWQEGYRAGELRGEVYPDVPAALARWSAKGQIICIFSSGSVLAQKLLFGSTAAGDLNRFIHGNFDTTVGSKHMPESYARIAETLALAPANILFISDVAKELDAAHEAGMQTALCERSELAERNVTTRRVIHSFEEILAGR